MRQVFTVGRGQFENIGDAVLRRQLVGWAREAGALHVYVGQSPPGYDECLGLQAGDRAYRDFGPFYRAALRAALRGPAAYVFKPGEVQLTLVGMKEHLVVVPLLALLRLRGGRAVRVGVGARGFAPLPRALMMPSVLLSDLTRWRDDATAAYMRVGAAMPDLAFGEGSDDATLADPGAVRDRLVISLRGGRPGLPAPSPEALEGVRDFARRRGLEVLAVTQVLEDDERSHELAAALGGRVLGWPGATGHHEHEAALREEYRRTALVVSDRLHVVIGAFTEGAAPAAGQVRPSAKLERHLSTVGVHDVALDLASTDAAAVSRRLDELLDRREESLALLAAARQRLEGVRTEVLDVLTGPRRPAAARHRVRRRGGERPVVHHLGRAGEVAGGMTQVLNGYLAGGFDRVDTALLTTRADPGDHLASVRLALRAALEVLRLPRGRSVVAAHLSGGGSFVREGLLLRLAHARGLATAAHLHGSSFVAFARRHPRLVRWVLSGADRVVSLSEASSAVAAAAVPAHRVHLVPNAVRLGGTAEGEDLVVFGGSVGRRKGVDVLLAAWSQVRAPGWRLAVAGPVLEPEVVSGAAGSVDLLGAVPHAELLRLLERSRAAVLPSRDEAMPVFVLEAMARGNAVVATDVGGVAAVLGAGRGLVVPPGDVEALRDALQRVVSDAGLREQLSGAAHEAARAEFSTDVVFPQLQEVWLGALDDRAARA